MDPSFQAYCEYLKNQSSTTLENSSNPQQPPPYQVSQQPPPYQVSQQPPSYQVSPQPPIFYSNQPHYAGNNSPNPQYVRYQQQPFIYQPHAGDGSQNPTHFVHPPPPSNCYSPQISSSSEKVPETQEYMLDEPTFPAEGDGHSSKKQSLKWCENDDIILLQTWLNISKDSVTGNDQKAEAFWRRIEHQYNKYRKKGSPERQWVQLKSRFHTLSKAVSTFIGCYKKVTNPPKSGYSERDIMADACSLYNAMAKTKTFKFEHAWRVLKDEPKWKGEAMSICSMRQKHSTDGVHTSIDGSEQETVQILSRPPRQKDVKGKAKAKAKAAKRTSNNEESMAMEESHVKEKNERMARLESLKKNDQLKMLNGILLQDTSNMNEEQLEDFKNICVYTRRQLEDLFKE